jgi:tetratricopeptide (TPR) repeat protein
MRQDAHALPLTNVEYSKMNKNSILFGITGLFIGLIFGFFISNNLNRNAIAYQNTAENAVNAPFLNQQTQAVSVKPNEGGMLPEVSETLDQAKSQPNSFEAQTKAGDMYAKIQKFDTAVKFYEKANQIKPDDYDTIVKIGNAYFDSNLFEKAGDWYEKALKKKSNDVNVRTDFGITLLQKENPDIDRAVKEFQTSLQTNPNHEPTLFNLGITYYKIGNSEEAKKILSQLEAVNPQGQLTGRLNQVISAK